MFPCPVLFPAFLYRYAGVVLVFTEPLYVRHVLYLNFLILQRLSDLSIAKNDKTSVQFRPLSFFMNQFNLRKLLWIFNVGVIGYRLVVFE